MDVRWLAAVLREELDGGWLAVCKIRTPDGWKRVPTSVNAEWYSVFCSRHEWRSSRRYKKPRTIIKRNHTRAALGRIAAGNLAGVYVERIVSFMLDWCEHYRKQRGKSCRDTCSFSNRRPATSRPSSGCVPF